MSINMAARKWCKGLIGWKARNIYGTKKYYLIFPYLTGMPSASETLSYGRKAFIATLVSHLHLDKAK